MCKLLVAVGLELTAKTDLIFRNGFMRTAAAELTRFDKDGFGYSAYSAETGLYGERWLDVTKLWKKPEQFVVPSALLQLGDMIDMPRPPAAGYSCFGTSGKTLKSVVLHGRNSTNTISIQNTHPFVDAEATMALSHNGVITNAAKFAEKDQISTCDSESILNLYKNHNVKTEPANIDCLGILLEGWYAVAVHHADGVVDIFKEARSNLYVAHVPELGPKALVFATTENIIEAACEAAKFAKPVCHKVNAGVLTRFDADGTVMESIAFDYDEPTWGSRNDNYGYDWAMRQEHEDRRKAFVDATIERMHDDRKLKLLTGSGD